MGLIDFGVFFHHMADLSLTIERGKKQGIGHFVVFPMNRDPEIIDWNEYEAKWGVGLQVPHLFFNENKFRAPRKKQAASLAVILDSIQLQEAYAHFLKAHDYGTLVMSFPHEKSLSPQGMAHESKESFILGLPELSPLQESLRVARDCELAQYFGSRLHFHQVSSRASVEIIRSFRSRGARITAGVSALHLLSTVKDLAHFEGKYKSLPPIRDSHDQMALWSGITDGTISNLCSGLVSYQDDENFYESPMGTHGLGDFLPQLQEIFSRAPYSKKMLDDLTIHNPRALLAGEKI